MYEATKSWRLSGTSPWMSTASQFTKPTTNAAIAAERDPDEERNSKEQPEEHGQPTALQVVVAHDEPDRPLRDALHGRILMHATRILDRLSISRDDVERAREVITGRLHRTPTLPCRVARSGARSSRRSCCRGPAPSSRAACSPSSPRSLPRRRRAGSSRSRRGTTRRRVAWGAAEEGLDSLVVMWRGASEARSRPRAATALRGPGGGGPGGGVRAARRAARGDGAHARPSVRRSVHDAGQGTVGLEILEDCPDVETIVVPIGGGGLIPVWRSPRQVDCPRRRGRARALDRTALGARGGRARRRDADARSPTVSTRRSCGSGHARRSARARRRGRARERGRDRGRIALPLHAGEAGVRAGRCRCGGGGPRGEGRRSRRTGRASSRAGTSAPSTAAAILARR